HRGTAAARDRRSHGAWRRCGAGTAIGDDARRSADSHRVDPWIRPVARAGPLSDRAAVWCDEQRSDDPGGRAGRARSGVRVVDLASRTASRARRSARRTQARVEGFSMKHTGAFLLFAVALAAVAAQEPETV